MNHCINLIYFPDRIINNTINLYARKNQLQKRDFFLLIIHHMYVCMLTFDLRARDDLES